MGSQRHPRNGVAGALRGETLTLEELISRAQAWRAADPDPETAAELGALIEKRNEAELADRFRGRLEFGTAGIRGVLGAGPSRMNRAVVRQTTFGLARYLLKMAPDVRERGVVVGRDGRKKSDVFCEDAASVLAAHGIPALVFREPVPTPLTAFATLELSAAAAVMITASHNPPEYNGYKVYWRNGAQIVPPHDKGIAAETYASAPANLIELLAPSAARAQGLWRELGDEVGEAYLKAIFALQVHPGASAGLKIVYTALHGVGGVWVTRAFARTGAELFPVPEQQEPDGAFPTVPFPNPEEPGALDLSTALAEKVGADLVLANDPDADRLSVVVRSRDGGLRPLTGNEVGVLLGHYLLTETRPRPSKPLVLTTIVSSAQLGAIARDSDARYEETLTGFKWIGNRALEIEKAEGATFLFGYEEALGYTVGRVVRDKDGIGAALVFADLTGFCRARGATVLDYLDEIRRRHGLFLGAQRSFTFNGAEGQAIISRVMDGFRKAPPSKIGEHEVAQSKDYLKEPGALPPSNVIAYELRGGSRVTLRPSGTEPKIKYYFEIREEVRDQESVDAATARGESRVSRLVEAFLKLARERGQPA